LDENMQNNYFYSLDGPLDSIPARRQMRSANLAGFTGLIRRMGADPVPLLERHGLDPRVIRDPDHFVDCKSVVDLLEYSSTALKAPLFGVQLAQCQDPEVFGCVATLCRAAPTVRDAVASFIEYIPIVHSPEAILELVESGETAEIRWRVGPDLGFNHQANYKAALLNLKLLRMVGGRGFRPSHVDLAVDPHERDVPELERQLGAKFNRTTGENVIAFPAGVLNRAVATSNRLVYKLLGGYLEQVKAACRKTVAERVQDYVRGSLSSGNCSIERCAMKLDISVRTLQSQLADAGLKFSDILEQQRLELARHYLEQVNLSLDDVADLLGYAEQSSFGRAFKRWTGLTPKLYRQQFEGSRRTPMPPAFSLAFANRAAGV
jgi:AraC-like DNA-binding protein